MNNEIEINDLIDISVIEKINSVIDILPKSFYSKKSLVCFLGGGNYGSVFIIKENNIYKACKFIRKEKNILLKNNIPMEAVILNDLNHPNIINFFGLDVDNSFYYIYTELYGIKLHDNWSSNRIRIKSSDCFEFIENNYISETQALIIIRQILSVFNYLHSKNIIYLDLKDENILIDKSTLQIKFCDFGSAYYVKNLYSTFDIISGTESFIPPEVIKEKEYLPLPCEIWTIGCLLIVMLTKKIPFSNITEILTKPTPSLESSFIIQNLVNKCTDKNPLNRISFESLNNHPWITKNQTWIA